MRWVSWGDEEWICGGGLGFCGVTKADERQTQYKMECWTIENLRQAVEKGSVKSIVPEQRGVAF